MSVKSTITGDILWIASCPYTVARVVLSKYCRPVHYTTVQTADSISSYICSRLWVHTACMFVSLWEMIHSILIFHRALSLIESHSDESILHQSVSSPSTSFAANTLQCVFLLVLLITGLMYVWMSELRSKFRVNNRGSLYGKSLIIALQAENSLQAHDRSCSPNSRCKFLHQSTKSHVWKLSIYFFPYNKTRFGLFVIVHLQVCSKNPVVNRKWSYSYNCMKNEETDVWRCLI